MKGNKRRTGSVSPSSVSVERALLSTSSSSTVSVINGPILEVDGQHISLLLPRRCPFLAVLPAVLVPSRDPHLIWAKAHRAPAQESRNVPPVKISENSAQGPSQFPANVGRDETPVERCDWLGRSWKLAAPTEESGAGKVCSCFCMAGLLFAHPAGGFQTTLLNVLVRGVDVGVTAGDQFANGQPLPAGFHPQTGYCQQVDSHEPTSTARDAVLFSTLQQPQYVPTEEKQA